ncbi:LrgB family protein [Longimicrobium sp.]|uniref:LrgB family protein n=1 Tax=Longimicrobium sp. TaxID=2029185 RepID=UPI003B3A5FC3
MHLVEALLAILATVAVYAAARRLQRRLKSVWLHPVLVSMVVLIAALTLLGIPQPVYEQGGRVLTFFLGPAVVALALPLSRQMETIGRRGKAVLLSLLAGAAVGTFSAVLTAVALGGWPQTVRTLAPRAVTTPIAIGISERLGGLPPLSAAVSILSGILGAVIGPPLLRMIGVRSRTAFGLALGAAAHGVGTARAAEEGEVEAASSGLAIGVMGVFTAVLAPLAVWLLVWLGWTR